MLKSSKVVHIKLGTPPEGARTIVWDEGKKERSMIVRAPKEWSVRIATEKLKEGGVASYCIAVSDDESEMRVTKMEAGKRPKELKMSKDDISKRLSAAPSEMSPSQIVNSLKGYIDPGEPVRPTRPGR